MAPMPTFHVWNTSIHFGLLAYQMYTYLKLVEDILLAFNELFNKNSLPYSGERLRVNRKFRGFLATCIRKSFSMKFGVWHPLAAQASNSQKFFSVNIVFSTNSQIFLPQKFPAIQ